MYFLQPSDRASSFCMPGASNLNTKAIVQDPFCKVVVVPFLFTFDTSLSLSDWCSLCLLPSSWSPIKPCCNGGISLWASPWTTRTSVGLYNSGLSFAVAEQLHAVHALKAIAFFLVSGFLPPVVPLSKDRWKLWWDYDLQIANWLCARVGVSTERERERNTSSILYIIS